MWKDSLWLVGKEKFVEGQECWRENGGNLSPNPEMLSQGSNQREQVWQEEVRFQVYSESEANRILLS